MEDFTGLARYSRPEKWELGSIEEGRLHQEQLLSRCLLPQGFGCAELFHSSESQTHPHASTVLNGACQGWCEPARAGEERYRVRWLTRRSVSSADPSFSLQPYGVSYSGASFKFTVLDPTGARRSTQCTFCTRLTPDALLTDLGATLSQTVNSLNRPTFLSALPTPTLVSAEQITTSRTSLSAPLAIKQSTTSIWRA